MFETNVLCSVVWIVSGVAYEASEKKGVKRWSINEVLGLAKDIRSVTVKRIIRRTSDLRIKR